MAVMIQRPCAVCQKPMIVAEHDQRKKYCSRKCLGIHNGERLKRLSKTIKRNSKPPVLRGQNHGRWVQPIRFTCLNCGNSFEKKPWQTQRSGRSLPKFCSHVCRDSYRSTHLSGENSPFWVGGEQTPRGRNWLKIRAKVVLEQEGRCANCNTYLGDSLPIHHIKPFRLFRRASDANRRKNLIGLCQPCHMHIEKTRVVVGRQQHFALVAKGAPA